MHGQEQAEPSVEPACMHKMQMPSLAGLHLQDTRVRESWAAPCKCPMSPMLPWEGSVLPGLMAMHIFHILGKNKRFSRCKQFGANVYLFTYECVSVCACLWACVYVHHRTQCFASQVNISIVTNSGSRLLLVPSDYCKILGVLSPQETSC